MIDIIKIIFVLLFLGYFFFGFLIRGIRFFWELFLCMFVDGFRFLVFVVFCLEYMGRNKKIYRNYYCFVF